MSVGKCEVGGDCKGSLHAHHDDYAFPDHVRLLCRRHHALLHHERGPGRNRHLAKRAWGFGTPEQHEVKTRLDSATRELLREEAQKLERSEAFIIRRALRAYFLQGVTLDGAPKEGATP